jgi:RNA polymerase sigma-70 factor (ECF subfamily)
MDTNSQRNPDEEVFLRLFMTEERAVLRFILRYLPAVTDARDVLQETLVTLWSKRAEFDATKEFLPWACGIARFKVREFWRKQPRWESFANDDLMALIDARSAVLEPELSLRSEKLHDCLSKLPDGQRGVVQRYYSEDEPVESLALREGRSVEAIYKLLQRVRRALLECIERGVRVEEALS